MDPFRRELTNPTMEKLLKAIELLRVLVDREMPAQAVSCFLYVASHSRCHKTAMEEDLGFTTASGSRNTDWLSQTNRLGQQGLGLIIKEADPSNKRRVMLTLSPKGEEISKQLERILYD
jgi:DNA-binding MarR family transcriptional regulator